MPQTWFHFTESSVSYFCLVDKDNNKILIGEGPMVPFTRISSTLEDFNHEELNIFPDSIKKEIINYVQN